MDPTAWKVDDVAVVDYLTGYWRSAERTFWEPIQAVPSRPLCHGDEPLRWTSSAGGVRRRSPRSSRTTRSATGSSAGASDRRSPIGWSPTTRCSSISAAVSTPRASRSWPGDVGAPVPLRAVGAVYPGLACDESLYMDAVKRGCRTRWSTGTGRGRILRTSRIPALAGPGRRNSMNNATRGDLEIAGSRGARVIL